MAMAAPASKPRTAALLLLCFLVASLLLASSFVAAAATEAYGGGRKMKQTAVHGYPGTNLPPGSYGSLP
ncbi:hypothetical protein BDA96_05G144400 [Sorghum bicolor]|uniref:Uncharacterized protein n=2 Tax=Sorghum bicolor TaxID=4558 RepID=A0A921UFC7_SORBI|nr:hypothetical protein BDA96_05G144400 [Sorghum bicolor]KXG28512.1 hypothetical protein SORBI_3005G131200 [Sorghum bicolor]